MTILTSTAANKKYSWFKTGRLFAIFFFLFILVSLPILPLRFLGIPGPDSEFGQFVPFLKEKFGVKQDQTPIVSKKSQLFTRQPTGKTQTLEEAKQKLLASYLMSSGDPSIENKLGLIALALGEYKEALSHFDRAVELSRLGLISIKEKERSLLKDEKAGHKELPLVEEECRLNIELTAAHANLARINERLGKQTQVISELEQLNKEGTIVQLATNTAKMKDGTNQSEKLDPEVSELLVQGEAYMLSRQFAKATEEFRTALAIKPDVAICHQQLGLAFALSGQLAKASSEFALALELNPKDAATHNNLGLVEQELGQLESARKEFEKALALNPKLVDAALNLGSLHSNCKRNSEAYAAFKRAVLANPNSAVAHNNLATVLSMQENYEKAIDEFTQAIDLAPNMACAHYGLGLALYQMKRYREASLEFRRTLAVDPSFSGAQTKLELSLRKALNGQGSAFGCN